MIRVHPSHLFSYQTLIDLFSYQTLIDHLFVLDRDADLVTPFLTQLTYEGALDEHFGIRAGVIEFPPAVAGGEHPLKMSLNSRDAIFNKIRNRHFAGVAAQLTWRARELQSRKNSTQEMSAAQMKSFVTNDLRALQLQQKSLSLHISACEAITKATRADFETQLMTEHGLVTGATSGREALAYLKDLIARQTPSRHVLRLLCLYSITGKGLSRAEYKDLCTDICNAYGHSHALTLLRLRRAGLLLLVDGGEEGGGGGSVLRRQVASSLGVWRAGHWQALARRLSLVPQGDDPIDLHNPSDMSYVFNGAYTPAIPRLVKEALTKGACAVVDALKLIPGVTTIKTGDREPLGQPVALVVVLGGITFAEIAALRLLGISANTKVLIASTSTTTGLSLVGSAIQN